MSSDFWNTLYNVKRGMEQFTPTERIADANEDMDFVERIKRCKR